MIRSIIMIFLYFMIGFCIANLIRLKKVRKELKKLKENLAEIETSEHSEEIKIILIQELMERMYVISKLGYFMW